MLLLRAGLSTSWCAVNSSRYFNPCVVARSSQHDHLCIFFVSYGTQSRPEIPFNGPFTSDLFRHISVEFGVTRVLSLETSEPRLEFKTSFCTFEQNLATQHGFERWTGKVKQYTAGRLVMIFDATKPLQEFDKIATF